MGHPLQINELIGYPWLDWVFPIRTVLANKKLSAVSPHVKWFCHWYADRHEHAVPSSQAWEQERLILPRQKTGP
jgi:hypothetical protein